MTALDIRSFLLGLGDSPATFTTKREAIRAAKTNGYGNADVFRAANRFQAFWVVGQAQAVGPHMSEYRLVCVDGAKRDFNLSYGSFN